MTVSTNTCDATEARAAILANGNGKPDSLRVYTENIPTELKQLDRWVGWRWEWDVRANGGRGKWSKPPVNVRTGRRASSTNKSTWCDFSTAYAAYTAGDIDGIGVVLGDLGDGRVLAGIDADGCRDLRTKQLSESVQSVIALVNSYSEVSPTGTGIKMLCFGKLPSGAREQGNLECYDSGRYFTLTGHRVEESPSIIREAETELHEFHGTFIAPPKNTTRNSDRELAVAALRGLASDRADSYRDWINVGMALHASDPGLLEEWDRWSCQSEKYSAGACAEKWQSFNGSGLGLGSLIFWARQDGWTPPQLGKARKNQRREQSNTNHDGESDDEPLPESDPWPDPLRDAALHGLAGEIVKAIEPHSEADPVALLAQLLAGFGCQIGRRVHFRAEADRHYSNLFLCMVGSTSKGRKGTSWGQVSRLLVDVDPDFIRDRMYGGLSSGEGLIWQVRDPIYKREPIREKRRIVGYQDVEVDPGVADKRLLVLESEFSSVLKVAARERNTISAIVRQAWDTGNLRTMTKNSPAKASGAHIAIIGHITRDELRQQIAEVDLANGLANRFLWLCVKRSKCLPEGGSLDTALMAHLAQRLTSVFEFALDCGEITRDEGARAVWHAVYPELSEGKPGLLGAATGRAEAQVMRLAIIYALLDQSTVVREEHLMAALAVWQYSEASARYIFGSALGNPTADELLVEIRRRGARGMSRTEMREHFGRHKRSGEIAAALRSLRDLDLIQAVKVPTSGRPAERWFACGTGCAISAESAVSPAPTEANGAFGAFGARRHAGKNDEH